jgi:hypothetical protein
MVPALVSFAGCDFIISLFFPSFQYGWINDSIEALVLEKFGAEIWDKVKAEAKCDVPNGAWVRHQYYDDATTYALAISVGKVLNLDLAVVVLFC